MANKKKAHTKTIKSRHGATHDLDLFSHVIFAKDIQRIEYQLNCEFWQFPSNISTSSFIIHISMNSYNIITEVASEYSHCCKK